MTTTPPPPSTPSSPMVADVAAALFVCAVDEAPASALPRALSWALRIWGGGLDDVPLAAIHDLGFVLLRGRAARLSSGRERFSLPELHDDTRATIRRERLLWEERVVAPALRDQAILQAAIIVAGAPEDTVDELVIHALFSVLPRLLQGLSPAQAATLQRQVPGAARPIIEAPSIVLGAAAVDDRQMTPTFAVDIVDSAVLDAALDLGELARGRMLDTPLPLLLKDELWELARLDLIPSEAMRLSLRTVHRTMGDIGPVQPAVVARLRDRRQDIVVDEVVADAFPAGGFDAMSTRGVLENLVRSEVGYVGVGAEEDPRAPDLFDVRFVEGELLYYTRDESPLLERRRQLLVHIDEVERLRHKVRELPSQTIVLVEAVVLQAFADLQVAFGPHVVVLEVAVSGTDAEAVAEENGLLRTSLHAELAHRRATLVDVDHLPLPGRITFSPRPPPSTRPAQRRRGLWVRVGGPLWELHSGADVTMLDPRTSLRALADRLLAMA